VRRCRAVPFLNGAMGSRGRGDGGSVAWRDAWKEGDGDMVLTGRGSAVARVGGMALSEQGSAGGL
jgi:hypothetical protein